MSLTFDPAGWQSPRTIINQLGLRPLQSLGQNFLTDRNLAEIIINEASIEDGDAIVEIGPGTGVLTGNLILAGNPFLCIEIDKGLAAYLAGTYQAPHFELLHGDVLDGTKSLHPRLDDFIRECIRDQRRLKIISNLPYNILTPFFWNLSDFPSLKWEGLFMVQREFAEKLQAEPGGKKYSPLGIIFANYYSVSILRHVGRMVFWPAPAVDSVLLQISRDPALCPAPEGYGEFLKNVFSLRRKSLHNLLKKYFAEYDHQWFYDKFSLDSRVRTEQLTHAQLLELHQHIQSCGVK